MMLSVMIQSAAEKAPEAPGVILVIEEEEKSEWHPLFDVKQSAFLTVSRHFWLIEVILTWERWLRRLVFTLCP